MKINNNYIQGVKLLTLYKQHYINEYPEKLKSEYSCWGYFDGLDVTNVVSGNSSLFTKKSQAAISDVWYQTAKKIQEQKGFYSQQNIGLFRCENTEKQNGNSEQDFWNNRKIFLTVCFIQLQNSNQIDNTKLNFIRNNIENMKDDKVMLLTYVTFDNADLILFLQSNSFAKITKKIEHLDKTDYIKYIHPICGVYQSSLDTLKQIEKGEYIDRLGNVLINDNVDEICINVVGDAGAFETQLKDKLLEENINPSIKIRQENISYAYMAAHENYNIYIQNSDMYSLLSLLKDNGVLTHQNKLFGNRIYNIETVIKMERRAYIDSQCSDRKISENSWEPWCLRKMELFKKYMEDSWRKKDEGLYSYFQTIIQTLNTLSQFENYSMAKNIFYMIYPSFSLFLKQLENAYESDKFKEDRKEIMNSIQNYLESVNSIIYHAIHMDQIFLMLPGCSGTSYSIPTKLNMFYLYILQQIVDILNDSSNEYAFFLASVMESKPYTHLINFNFLPGDRLISINLSQRSLFMPRGLIIILAHEIAHYVGNDLRQREERWERLKRTTASLLAEIALPYWMFNDEKISKILIQKKKKIYSYCKEIIQNQLNNIKIFSNNGEEIYHASQVRKILLDASLNILLDENKDIANIVRLSSLEEREYGENFDELIDLIGTFESLSHETEVRYREALANGTCDLIVWNLVKVYQEIFSDLAAFIILQFHKDDYITAFKISEGFDINVKNLSPLNYKRIKVMASLQGYSIETYWASDKSLPEERSVIEKDILKYWPNLDFVEIQMQKYIEACHSSMLELFEKTDRKKDIEEVRTALKIFSESNYTCQQIYDFIDSKAKKYANTTEIKLQKELQRELQK